MNHVPPQRHLLRAKDLADGRYHEEIGVDEMAAAAGLSRAYFSRQFHDTFGEPPHKYLLRRRLERAASLLRYTDHPVNEICLSVGLKSVGSFTTAFKSEYGCTPGEYRANHPPAANFARVPACVVRINGRFASAAAKGTNREGQTSGQP